MKYAKECVTTHLPNQAALKMDGAGALNLYSTVDAVYWCFDTSYVSTSRRA